MTSITVHGPLYETNINKVLVVAHAAGVKVHHNVVTEHTHKAEILKLSPVGSLPVLETKEGAIFESNAICRYLARLAPASGLLGDNDFHAAQVEQWIDFTTTCVAPAVIQLAHAVYGHRESHADIEKEAREHLNSALKVLDEKLKAGVHLVGSKTTIADLILAVTLTDVFRLLISEKVVKKNFAHVEKAFSAVAALPAFKEVVGPVKHCSQEWHAPKLEKKDEKHEKRAKDDKKKEEKAEKPAKDDKKKEEKGDKKKEAPKEEKKKEEKPKKKEEKHEEEEEEKPKKEEKNPLDCLPPSDFPMYDFKTLFVNAENKMDAMKFFWEKFDPAGYSIWFLHYQKVEGEFSKLFQVSNFAEGFLQKLEPLRKYAFAVHGVYGKDNNYEVKGCWVWRGLDHPAEFKEQGNYEYHTITRADPSNPADRQKVEEYWCKMKKDDVVDGLPVIDVSYFK